MVVCVPVAVLYCVCEGGVVLHCLLVLSLLCTASFAELFVLVVVFADVGVVDVGGCDTGGPIHTASIPVPNQ